MAEIYNKATINPKNNGSNCFQYALKAVLNYHNIKSHPERASNLKLFVDQYNLKEINFRPHSSKDWKIFDLNYKKVALNILFVPYNTKKVRLAYKSKHSRKRENQGVFLMITDGKKGHYLAVKSLPALLKRIKSNHNGNFHCFNCFHSYCTKNKLKKHERVRNDLDYCYVKMPNEDNKILKQPWRKVN